jgi:hypothetical protein
MIAPDGEGGAILGWSKVNLVVAQRIDGSGNQVWDPNGVAISTEPDAALQDMLSDGAGGAIFLTSDVRNDTMNWDSHSLFAQRINGSGVTQWPSDGVPICLAKGARDYGHLLSDGMHGAIAAWWDQRDISGTMHEYAQHVTASGITTWAVDGVPFALGPDDQGDQAFAGDGSGGAIAAWGDGRNGNTDIYAQKLNANPTYAGYRTFSPGDVAYAKNDKGIVGKPVTNKKATPNEINVLIETFRLGIFPGNPLNDGLGGMTVGLSCLKNVNGKLQVDRTRAKIRGWLRLGKWNPKARTGSNYQDVLRTLSTRGSPQNGTPRGFDFVREKTSMSPTKHNNALMGEQIALKLNLIASMCGVTKPGLGELRYIEQGNGCSNKLVRDIALEIDSSLSLPGMGWNYNELYNVASKINRAFEGTMGVLKPSFPAILAVQGVHEARDVPFLQENAGVQPLMVSMKYDVEAVPQQFTLHQNFPNPFNPATKIQFELPNAAVVTLKVYNLLGQEVATLLDRQEMELGVQQVGFNASQLASGVYFYRLTAEQIANEENGIASKLFITTKKMLLIR